MEPVSVAVTIRPLVDPLDSAEAGFVPCAVSIASDVADELTFESDLPLLDYGRLDTVEKYVESQSLIATRVEHPAEEQTTLAALGARLFDATLGQWGRWGQVNERAPANGTRVRLRIRTTSALVAAQPWELLNSGSLGGFLALDPRVDISRTPRRVAPARDMATRRPLRILVCGSTPVDLEPIDVVGEVNALNSILAGLGGGVEAVPLTVNPYVCTWAAFRATLADGPWDAVHFSGHGGFDPARGGLLVFTTEDGHSDYVAAARLAGALSADPALRLVVLNTCRGAMGAGRKVNDAVAGALVARGVPACVSMQFSVTDRAAMSFAGAFYGDLVARGDVELAVSSGRRAVAGARRGPEPEFSPYRSAEWSTPVLHLEAGGRLFASQPSAPPVVAGAAPSPPIVLLPERPASAGTAGRLQETSRNVWLLTFDTELEQAHALGRVEVGIRATMDVRRIDRTAHGLTASIGGLVPGTFAATEIVTATFTRSAGLTSVGIESRPRHGTVLFDYGRNEGALERLARHLSVTTA